MPHRAQPPVAQCATRHEIDGHAGLHAYTPARMQPKLTRYELDRLAEHYKLDPPGVDA